MSDRRAGKKRKSSPPKPAMHARQDSPSVLTSLRILPIAAITVLLLVAIGLAYRNFWPAPRNVSLSSLSPAASSIPSGQSARREAVAVADDLLHDYPRSAEALYARGVILASHGCTEEAAKTWQACLTLLPGLAIAYEQLGILAFREGDNEKAVALLGKAIELDSNSAAAGLYLGQALNQLGRMDQAIPVLEQFTSVAPNSPEPYFQLGHAYFQLGNIDQARKWYETALQADPGFVQAYYGLAQTCDRLGDKTAANAYREKYTQIAERTEAAERHQIRRGRSNSQASLAEAYLMAAKVHMMHKHLDKAQECAEKAKSIDPEIDRSVFRD